VYVITIAYAAMDDVDTSIDNVGTSIDNVDTSINENVDLVAVYVVERPRRGIEESSYFR
jgi:hypothetical protein